MKESTPSVYKEDMLKPVAPLKFTVREFTCRSILFDCIIFNISQFAYVLEALPITAPTTTMSSSIATPTLVFFIYNFERHLSQALVSTYLPYKVMCSNSNQEYFARNL